MRRKAEVVAPAYHLTFNCYGSRLHGDSRSSVDRFHNAYRMPFLPPDERREERCREKMRYPPYRLDRPRRWAALEGIILRCEELEWELHAAHVRTEHAHTVISSDIEPDDMIVELKSAASHQMNERNLDRGRPKRWAKGGSTPHLWTAEQYWSAFSYVLFEQGRPMAVYANPRLNIEIETEPNPFEDSWLGRDPQGSPKRRG